jgi:hypothetical protein
MAWQTEDSATQSQLHGVWCGVSRCYAVGHRGTVVVRSVDGWRVAESGTEENLYAVSGRDDEVVAVGGNLHIGGNSLIVSRARNGAWISEPSGMQHILLAIRPYRDGWVAAGYNGAILVGRSGRWRREDLAHYSHVFALCTADKRIFAAGLSGTVVEFEGAEWRPHATASAHHLRSMWACAEDHVVAVGLHGTILRYDGRAWSKVKSPTVAHLEGVWLESPESGYAVGYGGTILRLGGEEWETMDSCTSRNLYGVHGNAEHVVAVGEGGSVVRLLSGGRRAEKASV